MEYRNVIFLQPLPTFFISDFETASIRAVNWKMSTRKWECTKQGNFLKQDIVLILHGDETYIGKFYPENHFFIPSGAESAQKATRDEKVIWGVKFPDIGWVKPCNITIITTLTTYLTAAIIWEIFRTFWFWGKWQLEPGVWHDEEVVNYINKVALFFSIWGLLDP